MTAFASLFHEDGVWVLWTGEVWTGRRVIEEGHAAVHKTVFRNSVQRENLEEVTFVGPDAAIMRFCSVLTGDERAPNDVIRSRKFVVVTRRQSSVESELGPKHATGQQCSRFRLLRETPQISRLIERC